MKLSIFLIFLITVLVNNNLYVSSNSSSSDCVQSVKSVSEVNPYILNSLVVVKGVFCLDTTGGVSVGLYAPYGNSNVVYELDCDNDVTIDSLGEIITCRLSSVLPSSQPTNYTILTSVIVTTPLPVPAPTSSLIGIGPTPVLGMRGYLFTSALCPNNCSGNGMCDVGMTCRCNIGYASFDCSKKISNVTQASSSPSFISYDTVGLENSNGQMNIRLSHVIANPSLPNNRFTYQQQLSAISFSNTSSTSTDMSYSLIYSSTEYWFNSIWCNIARLPGNEPSFNYVNYKGGYMPQSSLSALMTIIPTINSQSTSFPAQIFNTSWTNSSYSIIVEISTNDGSQIPDDMTYSVSDVANAVSFTSDKMKTLLVFSLSDIYSFNGLTVGAHANLSVISNQNTNNLAGTSSSKLYLSINIPQTNTPIKTGNYTIQIMVNSYDLIVSPTFPPWKIGLIIGCVVGGLIVIVAIIAVVVYKKRRHSYSHIQDHHHHHHHHDHHKTTSYH